MLAHTVTMYLDPATLKPGAFESEHPHYATRTSTTFAVDNLSLLRDRGLQDDLLDSLVEGLPEGVIIAGGYLTSLISGNTSESKDVDVFAVGPAPYAAVVNKLLNPPLKPEGEKDTGWAWRGYTLRGGEDALKAVNEARFLTFDHRDRPSLQLIRLAWYTDAAHVLDTFDLTIAMLAVQAGGVFTYLPASFLDIARKRIVVRRLSFPASTLRRVVKYARKGYYACPGALANLCEQISSFEGDVASRAVVSVD